MGNNENLLHVDRDSWEAEVINSQLPVFVDFWAEWCGPCRMVGPAVEQLSKILDGKVKIAKVNVDENPLISRRFNIQSIPTLMILKEGQIVDIMIGALPKGQIENKIKQYIA